MQEASNNISTIQSEESSNSSLRWRFDVNTFRLLGRELITDRITAVFELVKNCYDANSTKVTVEFCDVSSNLPDRKIIIRDNGIGMSFTDIRDKWMVVGTKSKRGTLFSDPPFNRRFVGEKGIGRFAVDKLGEKLVIKTKQKGESQWLIVKINWDEYDKKAKDEQLTLFTEIDNEFSYEPAQPDEQGTILEISLVSEIWTEMDIERLYKELTKIVSPFYPLNPPFEVFVNSNEHKTYRNKLVKTDTIKYASHQASIDFDPTKNKQEILKFDDKTGRLYTEWTEIKSFGPIKLKLFYFNPGAKRRYSSAYKKDDTRIDGVKIYRNGIITTPFAEFESHPDKKRDILGIDKRLWRDIFYRISTREVIGVLDISYELNRKIVDSTNRQDFVDNQEYRDLKSFVIEQLDVLSEIKKYENEIERLKSSRALEKAGQDIKLFKKEIEDIEHSKPELRNYLKPLKERAAEVAISISKGVRDQKKFQQEATRRENIYLSLMSLQEYASHISHAVRTSLSSIKDIAEFFKNNFPDAKYEGLFKEYSVMIYDEMERLSKVIDFMLSYAASNTDFEDFSVKQLIEDVLLVRYKTVLEKERIRPIIDIKDDVVINSNKKFFEDIIQNLVSNSVKALQEQADKIIKCTGYVEDDYFMFLFSDNGRGIADGDEQRIFEIYYTTTAEQGGAGLGLFIVRTRIEALKGTVEVAESEFKPKGATFKITLPFKKSDK